MYLATTFSWLLLMLASMAWCGFLIHRSALALPPDSHTVVFWHALNILVHLLIVALGCAAIGLVYRHLRRSRTALKASEERYRMISTLATDYVYSSTVNTNGTLELQWVAGAFESITGYSLDEYRARGGWQAMVHPDDRAQDARDLEVLRSNHPVRSELRTLAKNGTTVWVEVFAQPLWDPDRQRLAGIYGAVRDISRRKQAEAEWQASLETLNHFVDSVPAFGSFVDTDERYQFVNRYHENWFKNPRQQFVGRRLAEVHRPSTYAIMRPYSQQALAGQRVRYEHEMTGRDGKYYCFDVQYIPRRASDGSILGYFSLVFDITERVLRERQQLRTQRLESVGRLASGIAHDLNNILTPMMMGSDLLRSTLTDPAATGILNMIDSSAKRGAAILKQLLMFGRGEQEAFAPLRLHPLIQEMAKIIEETFPKNINLRFLPAPDLPAVLGNVTQLHQVLMNLCINARDAMPGGGTLSLSARVETIDEPTAQSFGAARPGPHVVLEVADTGSGIPPEIQDKIFDPFFTTKPMGVGTGLGLSTVLGIVRSHKGFIRVDSPPSQGTSFRIHLPVCPETGPEVPPPPAAPAPQGRGERILLVDDEDSFRRVARHILEKNGYPVLEARNGQEALDLLQQSPSSVALVITDLVMPVMDGSTLIRHLHDMHSPAKIITITGGLSPAEMIQAVGADSSAFLLKPFGPALLLETIRRVLDAAPAPAS